MSASLLRHAPLVIVLTASLVAGLSYAFSRAQAEEKRLLPELRMLLKTYQKGAIACTAGAPQQVLEQHDRELIDQERQHLARVEEELDECRLQVQEDELKSPENSGVLPQLRGEIDDLQNRTGALLEGKAKEMETETKKYIRVLRLKKQLAALMADKHRNETAALQEMAESLKNLPGIGEAGTNASVSTGGRKQSAVEKLHNESIQENLGNKTDLEDPYGGDYNDWHGYEGQEDFGDYGG